jgi:hypothetical protein
MSLFGRGSQTNKGPLRFEVTIFQIQLNRVRERAGVMVDAGRRGRCNHAR